MYFNRQCRIHFKKSSFFAIPYGWQTSFARFPSRFLFCCDRISKSIRLPFALSRRVALPFMKVDGRHYSSVELAIF